MTPVAFGPETWPRDYSGYVFVGRAFDRIGAALFGAEWQWLDIYAQPLPDVPPFTLVDQLSTLELHRIHTLLHQHRPERGLPEPPSVAISRAPPPPRSLASSYIYSGPETPWTPPFTPTADDAREARVVIAELNVRLNRAQERANDAWDRIVSDGETSRLKAFLLGTNGEFVAVPDHFWRTTLAHQSRHMLNQPAYVEVSSLKAILTDIEAGAPANADRQPKQRDNADKYAGRVRDDVDRQLRAGGIAINATNQAALVIDQWGVRRWKRSTLVTAFQKSA